MNYFKVRKRAEEEGTVTKEELGFNLHICSVNNFPTAAGLASSAAGYACLGNMEVSLELNSSLVHPYCYERKIPCNLCVHSDYERKRNVQLAVLCLFTVYALAKLYGITGDISAIARRGSGSACRSVYGGFVEWIKGGEAADGRDSIARQIVDSTHWPEIRVLILVVRW